MKNLIIEKRNKVISSRKEIIENIINRYDGNMGRIVQDLNDITFGLKVGYGGSHIWFANEKNERVAVVYF